MSSFTPGPWEWASDDNNLVIRPQRIPEDNEVFVIAVLPLESYEHLEDWSECSWSAEGEANARLIAAAPEMLELLNEATRAIWEFGVYLYDDEKRELTDRIDALLRRIEGKEAPK